MKKLYSIGIAAGIGLMALPILAGASQISHVSLSSTARKINDNLYALGTFRDPHSGRLVQGYSIIHRKDEPQKPSGVGNGHHNGGSTTSTCYAYLAKGAKWKTTEPWVMNPTNNQGLNTTQVFDTESAALAKWEDAADGVVGNGQGTQIFGNGSTTTSLPVDMNAPDNVNGVEFGDLQSNSIIAVTNVWGIWSGPPSGREIVEWDQVFNEGEFPWSLSGAANAMDFENIATHEVGHAAGMAHPSDTCTLETMYRYADYGETLKRDLHDGDIAGINNLY